MNKTVYMILLAVMLCPAYTLAYEKKYVTGLTPVCKGINEKEKPPTCPDYSVEVEYYYWVVTYYYYYITDPVTKTKRFCGSSSTMRGLNYVDPVLEKNGDKWVVNACSVSGNKTGRYWDQL